MTHLSFQAVFFFPLFLFLSALIVVAVDCSIKVNVCGSADMRRETEELFLLNQIADLAYCPRDLNVFTNVCCCLREL